MVFREVPSKVDFPAQERELLADWQEGQAFQKLRLLHAGDPHWSFIDGPITANNPMGVHHGWGRTYKDLLQRFWTMRGRRLRYQNGFDCQGLWVEVEVEKEQGFATKKDIEAFGLERFVRLCKARVLRQAAVQTEQSIRLGYWMDWNDPQVLRSLADRLVEDPDRVISLDGPQGRVTGTVEELVGRLGLPELGGSYFTFSAENNYMIWAFLKKCWEEGWLYRGADVMPWCPRCATGLSQHEIVTDGYAELTHEAVTVKFPLREVDSSALRQSLLVWTTTPWTLSSNVAAAVGPELAYLRVRQGDEIFYLSRGALSMLQGEYQVLGELRGREMEGWAYAGPFDDLPAAQKPGGQAPAGLERELGRRSGPSASASHRVILWEAVGEAEGTGIVHIAPGCGAEDFQLGKEYNLPLIAPLDEEGHFVEGFGWLTGKHVSQSAGPIFADLERKGLLYRKAPYSHRYPTCWRCHSELVFRLVEEWFISMGAVYDKPREALTVEEKARSLRYQIMDVVDQVRWIPDFGYARELDWLLNMHDWMISKKRYWGLALPVWTCAACGQFEVIGSETELEQRATAGWEVFTGHPPHRPHVDAVKLACPECGGVMNRVPDVGNPWLDAGIVPFSTLGYRQDREYWESWYPAHWITESFPGQFRNWFYSLLAMATVMDGSPPFREVFGYATLLAEDGREMHKSWGNSIEFNEAADRMGVDVMRWMYCSHKPENDLLFGYGRADEVRRGFLLPLWNAYSFFVTYANVDGWSPTREGGFDPGCPEGPAPRSSNALDRWILARLEETVAAVTAGLENSDPPGATGAAEGFLDDLTNWYIRRSRRRFWRSRPDAGGTDADKEAAYATLYYVLVRFTRLLAPFIPFLAEAVYQNLVRQVQPGAYESVHHTAWPAGALDEQEHGSDAETKALVEAMALARSITSLSLSARNSAGLKVRQPLAKAYAFVHPPGRSPDPRAGEQGAGRSGPFLDPELVEIIADELNVKAFELVSDPGQLVSYKALPNNKLLGPRLGALLPRVREALASDPSGAAAAVEAGEPLRLELDGQAVELAPEEVLVQTLPAPGLAVAAGRLGIVAVDAELTTELRWEGLARETVRRVQAMRREAGFNVDDRITTYYQAEGELAQVIATWGDYLRTETLSTSLVPGEPPQEALRGTHNLDGQTLVLGVARSGAQGK
jgi:isoleucyl-tRNA synthetase